MDIDWEYPGGNGEDYKTVPNSEKAWEIDAYPKLLHSIRQAVGSDKLISAAVPGLPRDMLAFTSSKILSIMNSINFLNVMTYDLMNRRDNVTKHHTGILNSLEAMQAYHDAGVRMKDMNLGLAFYVKWFKTDPNGGCDINPIGCKTELMEDPDTGADLGRAGAFSWHDEVPQELSASFNRAMEDGQYDHVGGGHYYWDAVENVWWSWDTPEAIEKKVPNVAEKTGLGGVFAWGLGEDGERWEHLETLNRGFHRLATKKTQGERDEL